MSLLSLPTLPAACVAVMVGGDSVLPITTGAAATAEDLVLRPSDAAAGAEVTSVGNVAIGDGTADVFVCTSVEVEVCDTTSVDEGE